MKNSTSESFFFSNTPDKYIFSIINLIRPSDDYILKNDYSKKIIQINSLAPEKNKIKKDLSKELFVSDILKNFFFEFFEIHGTPLSSNTNDYFSLKKGVLATNEIEAFNFFVFINALIKKLIVLKIREIEKLSFIEKLSPRLNRVKRDLILSVKIIDNNISRGFFEKNTKYFFVKKINSVNYRQLGFYPEKKTLSKRVNILKISSFSNNSLSVSEIYNATKNTCCIINKRQDDCFFIDDNLKIIKASLAFSLTKCVFLGKKISSIKSGRLLTPFLSKYYFYMPSKTAYDAELIKEVKASISESRRCGYFILFDDSSNSFESLNPYEHYVSFLFRNNYCGDKDFFKNVLPDSFHTSRDRARCVISNLNRMIREGQIINSKDLTYTDSHNNALKIRNSIIERKIEALEKIKSSE